MWSSYCRCCTRLLAVSPAELGEWTNFMTNFEHNIMHEGERGGGGGGGAYTYNISSLTVNTIFNGFWSQPPNWNLLLTPFFTLTKVVTGILSCVSPKSATLITPFWSILNQSLGPHVKKEHNITSTNIEFLAARSR